MSVTDDKNFKSFIDVIGGTDVILKMALKGEENEEENESGKKGKKGKKEKKEKKEKKKKCVIC